ncbi:MAG: SGNH/GDSL hydrolase family protein [Algoriphagus sp.]|nr:SGNH/GDSL hydrolase family protein [Algoriphagus sp.]
MGKILSQYAVFQAKLYPVLPFLIYQAYKVKKQRPIPKAQSEFIKLGNGPQRLLILGESTAAGVGASSAESTLAGNIYRLFGETSTVTNLGKNGIRASQVLPFFAETLKTEKIQTNGIFIFLGANDCFQLTNPSDYNRSLLNLIRTLESDFNPDWIYLADIPPVHLFPAFPGLLQSYLKSQREFLREEMKQLARGNPKIVFDELILNLLPGFFCEDLVHPSDIGYRAIAEFAFDGLSKRGILH